MLKFDKHHPAAPFCRPQDLTWWQERVASVSATHKIGGVRVETGPLGSKYDKTGFFAKKIDFCLMPTRNQNLQRGGGGR